ncbi:hypothetical protein [Halocatena halophila]|uniref:hypothetical protein n=1 Tax=Halocatena halophila TaxID=2814576 RepID=UPI002ECFBA0E
MTDDTERENRRCSFCDGELGERYHRDPHTGDRFCSKSHLHAADSTIEDQEQDDELPDELIEALSGLEHRQWMSWSRYVADHHDIPEELEDRWEQNWMAYSELSEGEKEKDRKWAREVIAVLDDYGVVNDE